LGAAVAGVGGRDCAVSKDICHGLKILVKDGKNGVDSAIQD
jgi:hypothetical protein